MKRIFAFILAALLLFAVPASAFSPHVDTYFSCFFDGYRASRAFNSPLGFDSLIIDLYFPPDDDLAYYSLRKLSGGVWTDTGVVSAVYAATSSREFTLTMPDGSVYPGYFDLNGEDVWLDIGAGFFRLHRVREMNLFEDWTKK